MSARRPWFLEVVDNANTQDNLICISNNILNLALKGILIGQGILEAATYVDSKLAVSMAFYLGDGVIETCKRINIKLIVKAKIYKIVKVGIEFVHRNTLLLEEI